MTKSRLKRPSVLLAAGAAAAGIGLVAWAATSLVPGAGSVGAQPLARQPAPGRSHRPPPAPAPPLVVTASQPEADATGVKGTDPVVFSTNQPVDLTSVSATISPPTTGQWSTQPGALVFTPSGAFPPSTRVTINLSSGLTSRAGGHLSDPVTTSFTTASGSVLRLQELLAQLGYLPLRWTPPAAPAAPGPGPAERAVFEPPAGTFAWAWNSPPAQLVALWAPGDYTVMIKGAVMAFEADHGLAVDGIAGVQVWSALVAGTDGPTLAAPHTGYTYALASKTRPETLTVWHNGTPIATTRANTGIPAAPTADGTFPVYERLATQVMKGTNPDGTPYADPVAWVAYFNGGDAIHYIARTYYGYPQSLGCVEVPYQVAKTIWPYLTIGTLVTVTG